MVLKNYVYLSLSLIIFFIFSHSPAFAETMFEGYYQIRSGGVHVGFVVQEYSFDKKKKQFSTTYYIKTGELAGNITESLKAVSNDQFQPISYQYTSKIGAKIQSIDASFKGQQMSVVVSDGKVNKSFSKEIPKGTFLASFLGYMLLSKGLNVGKVYNYYGIAEEKAEVLKGKVLVKEELVEQKIPSLRLLNEYGNTKYISVLSKNGEVMTTKSPVQGIETKLVSSPAEATKGFMLDTKTLRILFGRIPKGKINQLNKMDKKVSTEEVVVSPPKKTRTLPQKAPTEAKDK